MEEQREFVQNVKKERMFIVLSAILDFVSFLHPEEKEKTALDHTTIKENNRK